MNPLQLPPAAENVRKYIKDMIPETTTLRDGLPDIQTEILDDGNKTYLGTLAGGKLLAQKISLLAKEMRLDGWGWHLVHFSDTTKLKNDRKQGCLIPLSDHTTLTPGGLLHEGSYINITTEPLINSGATIIILVPRQ